MGKRNEPNDPNASICAVCDGKGTIENVVDVRNSPGVVKKLITCQKCNGKGTV